MAEFLKFKTLYWLSPRVLHAALSGFVVRAQSSLLCQGLLCGEQNSLSRFCVCRLRVSIFVFVFFGLWFEAFLEIIEVPLKVMDPVFKAFNFRVPV